MAAFFGVLFAAVEMVVPAATLHDGEAIDRVDAQMKGLAGLKRLPRIELTRKELGSLTRRFMAALLFGLGWCYTMSTQSCQRSSALARSSSPARIGLVGSLTCSRTRARRRSIASR